MLDSMIQSKLRIKMFSNEQRFVWDVDELIEIEKNPSEKNLVGASAILRRLFMDSSGPLIHKVTRKLDMKMSFAVAAHTNRLRKNPQSQNAPGREHLLAEYFNPDPSIGISSEVVVNFDEFLAMPIAYFDGKYLTVKDMISYVANVGGGVHQGLPRSQGNSAKIHATANSFVINNKPYPLENIRNIISITVKALMPVYIRLRA